MLLETMIFIKIVNSIAVKLYAVCDYIITINVFKLRDSEKYAVSFDFTGKNKFTWKYLSIGLPKIDRFSYWQKNRTFYKRDYEMEDWAWREYSFTAYLCSKGGKTEKGIKIIKRKKCLRKLRYS